MLRVPGNKGKIMVDRRCGDKDIHIPNELSLMTEIAAYPSEALHDCTIQRADVDFPQESPEAFLAGTRVASEVDPFVDLPESDQADR